MDLQHNFGIRVRELRERLGLTQAELAKRCGLGFSMQRIGEIERGNTNCTLETIAALSRGLGCEAIDLFLFRSRSGRRSLSLPDARLMDLWHGADADQKSKILRILGELL